MISGCYKGVFNPFVYALAVMVYLRSFSVKKSFGFNYLSNQSATGVSKTSQEKLDNIRVSYLEDAREREPDYDQPPSTDPV